MHHGSLPDSQSDQQEGRHDPDVDADLINACDAAQHLVDPWPQEHGADDESRTDDSHCQREQLEPAERDVEEPLGFDHFGGDERIGFGAHRRREDRGEGAQQDHQHQTDGDFGQQVIREEVEVFGLVFRLVLELQFGDAVQSDKGDVNRNQNDDRDGQNGRMQNLEA